MAGYQPGVPREPGMRTPVGDLGAPAKAQQELGAAEAGMGREMETLGLQQEAKNEAERKRLEAAAKAEQAQQDTLRAEDAYNQLRNRQLDLTTGEGGFTTLKGAQAVNQPILKTYSEQFDQSAQEIAAGLANDDQRTLFSRRAAVASLQFKEGILHHVIAENNTYGTQVFNGLVETETRSATDNWQNPASVMTSIERVNAGIKLRAERGGWPDDYANAVRLKEDGGIHNAVISQALASGNIAYAQQWFEDHKEDVDKATAVKLETAVRDGTQRQLSANYTSMLLQAHDSPKALTELEKRVTADQTLDDTRRNALIGQIMGRRETLNNALDRQYDRAERQNDRAQLRQERAISRGVDAIRTNLSYGEPSMQQLEPLITAAKGTPMESEVAGLVNTVNATRQFRMANPIQQETFLTQLRAAARTDPTKVDAQTINTLQGIFDGQQRQLKESGVKFVVQQGLVDPNNPAVAPLDPTKPDTMGKTLPLRLQLARAITDQYGAPMKPLTPEEADAAKATLALGNIDQRRDWFSKLAGATGNDTKGYAAVMAQIAPDQPVLAIAGIAANRRYDAGQGKLVADLMLRGEAILNPPRTADGKPDTGKLLPMPNDAKMRLDFDNTVREAFADNANARSDYYQAARAIYAAKSSTAGDKDTTVLDSDRWQESIRLATGGIDSYNGKRVVLPWGKTLGEFRDGLNDRINLVASNGRLPDGVTPSRLRDLPVQPIGDGRYVFRAGDSVVMEKPAPGKTPRPLVIDFNQAPAWIPSGGMVPTTPTADELGNAKDVYRGRVKQK